MNYNRGIFNRSELLFGRRFMERISAARIIIFGVGGVGSWCAEMLVRQGVKYLTIVDSDRICITNINRQIMATTVTVGKVKVEVLKTRLLEINPDAEIVALQKIYSPETHESFKLETYDFIIDAIDSLQNKVFLIQQATKTDAVFFSSMGAALKSDPTRIKVAEFWKVQACPLAAALRSRIKKSGGTGKKFLCVYSDELLTNKGENAACGTAKCMCPKALQADGAPDLINHEWCSQKAKINGTTSYIPAMFGMTIAGLVVKEIEKEGRKLVF